MLTRVKYEYKVGGEPIHTGDTITVNRKNGNVHSVEGKKEKLIVVRITFTKGTTSRVETFQVGTGTRLRVVLRKKSRVAKWEINSV